MISRLNLNKKLKIDKCVWRIDVYPIFLSGVKWLMISLISKCFGCWSAYIDLERQNNNTLYSGWHAQKSFVSGSNGHQARIYLLNHLPLSQLESQNTIVALKSIDSQLWNSSHHTFQCHWQNTRENTATGMMIPEITAQGLTKHPTATDDVSSLENNRTNTPVC